ncbi:MAG TPA: hypothetical protein VK486_13785, partial [Thermoleophilaceae bacterium]|nr:hypothetical protein [Thermoleophilaceae bacterium]
SEDRSHKAPVACQVQVAHCVHGLMHAVEPPPPHLPIDRVIAQPERPELNAGHDPVLSPRELHERVI